MARIRTYALDNNVTGSDYWIGTDGNDNSNTKNFSPNSVAKYLNENEIIDVSNSIRFKYDTIDSGQQRKEGTLSFQNEIGATVPMEDLTSFVLSKKTQSGKDVSFFLNVLPTTKVILHKSNDINLFGLYKVLSVETDILEPNFFNVSLEFISGHGSIEEDKDYIISLIDLDKTIPILQLTKETFNYASSSSFTLSNTIGNILQVIINATSLHPEGYSYTLPSTVTILNELHSGDVITIVYNYLEEFLEVPDLQRVTNIGNHTTNSIVIDNTLGEWGDYTTINTISDLGTFQSLTSPTNIDYQSEYSGYGMYINEIYSATDSREMFIESGTIQTSYTDVDDYNEIKMYSGSSTEGPVLSMERNYVTCQLKINDMTESIILQIPNKTEGTYTIATTSDVANKENSANKQNSLAVDGTGTKFPTVDAVNTLATSLFEQVNVITTNTYTIQASDASNVISFNYPSNSFMTVTMPNNSVIPFPIGTRIKINRIAGLWGINISGTGVDFLRGNQVVQTTASMDGFGGTSTLTKISTNRWRIDDANPFVFSYPNWSSSSNISAGSFSSGWFKGTNFGIDNQAYISFGDTITLNKVNGYFAISGTQTGLNTTFAFGPTAGTAVFNTFNLSPTINQTGGANGITRGLYINPTLTSAVDFRAIEVTSGKVIVPTAANSNEAINKGQLESYTTAQLAGKMNNPSLTANYIPKALTATTIGNSRLLDTGTYLGIETVNTPTKDITLGNQANREIGIEESTNIVVGRDLAINAGRTVNYVPSTGFIRLNLLQVQYYGADSLSNGDILITGNYNLVYKLVSGSPPFVNHGIVPIPNPMISIHPTNDNIIYSVSINISTSIYISTNGGVSFSAISGITPRNYIYVKIMPNGDAYATVSGSNDIYKRTGGTGDFIAMGFTARSYRYIISTPSGDAYFPVTGDDIYKINSGASVLTALGQTFRNWANGYFLNGDLYIAVGATSYKQTGLAGNFVLNTLFTYPVNPVGNLMNVTVSKTTNNVYVPSYDSDVWVQYNNGEGTSNLNGGKLKLYSGTGKGTGASDIEMWTGQVLASGTTMQTATLRAKIDNEGLMTLPSVTNALIEADTTGKAVVTKEYVATLAPPSFLEFNATDKTVWNNGFNNLPENTSFGEGALRQTTGIANNAFGTVALYSNVTGNQNCAFGINSMHSNYSGSDNVAFGNSTLANNYNFSYNTAIGHFSLNSKVAGNYNTALGYNSGRFLNDKTTGLTSISNSVFIGNYTSALSNGDTNEIVIGDNAVGAGSNTATLGNDSITSTILKGLVKAPLTTNALIEADATGKALVTKEYVGLAASFTATGTATTTFTVTIGTTQANNTYKVVASPSNALSAVMFYINNKTTTTFDVVFVTALTGAVAFDWILKP